MCAVWPHHPHRSKNRQRTCVPTREVRLGQAVVAPPGGGVPARIDKDPLRATRLVCAPAESRACRRRLLLFLWPAGRCTTVRSTCCLAWPNSSRVAHFLPHWQAMYLDLEVVRKCTRGTAWVSASCPNPTMFTPPVNVARTPWRPTMVTGRPDKRHNNRFGTLFHPSARFPKKKAQPLTGGHVPSMVHRPGVFGHVVASA